MKKKVAVAMSGGVDSGVAAALLVKQGYQCTGFYMRLWTEGQNSPAGQDLSSWGKAKIQNLENKCCSAESLEAARKTAHRLGMPFYVIDFSSIFKKKVVDYFLKAYGDGLTPNPCVVCNRFVKFGELLKYVRGLGFDYLATGHYARISAPIKKEKLKMKNENATFKIYHLLQAVDKQKDQSYFLYHLGQKQLAHVLFPVGGYLKKEVVAMAKAWQLPVAHRPESQEICFFPETDYRPFLQRQIPQRIIPGEVVDTEGRVIGKHFGLPLYTIGQRHGFNVNVKSQMSNVKSIPPYYVIGKDAKKNQLIVGFGKETERKEFWVKEVSWVDSNSKFQIPNSKLLVRLRHQGDLLKCKMKTEKLKTTIKNSKMSKSGLVKVILDEPERGIAPGQAAVFYQKLRGENDKLKINDYIVLGGGIIAVDKC
jgi:tRNA-specific 2-thiouridylase